MRPAKLLLVFWIAGSMAYSQVNEKLDPPTLTPEDLKAGQRLYQIQCAYCHGPGGEGGRGAPLNRPQLRRAADDQALFNVIRRGIPGTEMPHAVMTTRQYWQVVGFVRSLSQRHPSSLSGNPQIGRELYLKQGNCSQCHTLAGLGGAIGPDLSDIGARSGSGHLRQALLDPEANVPSGFLQVRLITSDGRQIRGVRLNEDAFSLQIRDVSGQFHSFWKKDLAQIHKEWGKSPMPSYRDVYTPAQLDDLVAYLASLGVDQ